VYLKVLWTIAQGEGLIEDIKMLRSCGGIDMDVLLSDYEENCIGFAYTGKSLILPLPSSDSYIASLISVCQREGVTTVIPQYGKELLVLSQNADHLEKIGVMVLVSRCVNKLRIAMRKDELYACFAGEEFIPEYRVVDGEKTLECCLGDLGYPDEEICIKPVEGEASEGVFLISAHDQDRPGVRHVPTISLDVLRKGVAGRYGSGHLMCMQFLPGDEFSADCVAKDGRLIICVPRRRCKTVNGLATVAVLENNREIAGICESVIRKL
jgi:carbamoyl-phosphate synthase large subunit